MPSEIARLCNLDAEASIIGGIFLRPDVIAGLTLEIDDFYSPKNQAVYQAMRNLEVTGRPIDIVTVDAELVRLGRSEAVGGLAYLMDASLRVPSRENVTEYASVVERLARRRIASAKLFDLADRIRQNDDVDGEDVVMEAINELKRLDLREQDPTRALGDLMMDEIRSIERDMDESDRGVRVGFIPSGIDALDAITGGLPLGVVTMVLGETGHGKSSLGMTFARNAYRLAGDESLVLSYEDSVRGYAKRGLAQESGIPTTVIGRRAFRPGDQQAVTTAGINAVSTRRERFVRLRGKSVEDSCRLVRRLRMRGPTKGGKSIGRLVVFDYFQRIPQPRERWIDSRVGGLEHIAHALEDLAAGEHDADPIAVVVLAQMNDEASKRSNHRPVDRDCDGGRALPKAAKLSLGIYRPFKYGESKDATGGEIIVMKQNEGEAHRTAPIRMDLQTHTIRDVEDP